MRYGILSDTHANIEALEAVFTAYEGEAIDRYVVDGFVWLFGFIPQLFGFTLKLTTQRGSLQGYAAAMLFAIALILLVLFL